jgi:hypothetical protein
MIMILSLVGCGTPPKNPAEFRAMAKDGNFFLSNEAYVVKRPFQQVVDTYRQRAPACLNQTIETNSKQGQARIHEVRAWKAKVNATNKHMECTLQSRVVEGNVMDVYEYPNKDGHYFMLVDAYPVDQNSTRIVLSKAMGTSDVLIQATRNWATGESMGCPDMTQ